MENKEKEPINLEVKIEQYPTGVSPHLIEEFFIMGYESILKEEKIINPIIKEIENEKSYKTLNHLKDFTILHLPSIISSITMDSNCPIVNNEIVLTYIFPIPPKIFYCMDNSPQSIPEPEISKIVFNNINNETVFNGYAYCFYEKEKVYINEEGKEKIIIYIPKAFVITSQYTYFQCFHKICQKLHEQFLKDNIEIPLEIQVYNLVNFIPSPINNDVNLSAILSTSLSSIKKYNNSEEYKIDDSIFLEQLAGYKHSEINFCKILDVLPPQIVFEVYMHLLCNKTIAFFSGNKELLNYILLAFSQFSFPLTPHEFVYSLNPNKYFTAEESINYIFGFLSPYSELPSYNPFKKDQNNQNKRNYLIIEDEKLSKRTGSKKAMFKCDYILDIDKSSFEKFIPFENLSEQKKPNKDTNNEEEEEEYEEEDIDVGSKNMRTSVKEKEEYAREFLFKYFKDIINEESNNIIRLDKILNDLYNRLKNLSIIVKDKKIGTFFIETKESKIISEQIEEAFFSFNILLCDNFFSVFSNYHGQLDYIKKHYKRAEEENESLSQQEKYFYNSFQNSLTWDILMNFIHGYSKREPKNLKVTKRGFENLLALIREDKNNEYFLRYHYINLIDCVFKNKKDNEKVSISFFEFYKYYEEKLKSFISRNINNDIIDKKIVKKDKDINFYYKYKDIIFDQELIFKYSYYLEELQDEIKDKIFPMRYKDKSIEKIIHTKDFYNSYDKYMIRYNMINARNLIQFCILNIVVLSISELKLIHFAQPIYSLIKDMNLGVRKYVELILNASYRFLFKKGCTLVNEANQYFDIYKKGIEEKNIFPNDELILIENEIKGYMSSINDQSTINPNDTIVSILNKSEDKLFDLSFDNDDNKKIIKLYENLENQGEIKENISLISNLLEKEIKSEFIYYPITLYQKLNELVDKYYKDLDFEILDKDEYDKLIVYTIYYVKLINKNSNYNFPEGIQKFLFHCLIHENKNK